jgi:hypothetical protein
MSTYIRKYYLHRMVKQAGFRMKLEERHKTILIPVSCIALAKENKYIDELREKHQYGVQTIIG